MLVKEIMSKKPTCLTPDATLQEAANEMRVLDVGFIPVEQYGKVIGIVTDRDIAVRAIAEGYDPNNTVLSEVMTTDIVTCCDEDDIDTAAKLMRQKQIRRLIVLDENDQLTGVISLGDIANCTDNAPLSGKIIKDVSEPTT